MTLAAEKMRRKLPDRRQGVTETLWYCKGEAAEKQFAVTFNWEEDGRVREVFALAFKAGTDLQSMLHHSCIITSVALQMGATMASLAHSLGEDEPDQKPKSMMGLIVRAGVIIDDRRGFPRDGAPPPTPEFLRGLA